MDGTQNILQAWMTCNDCVDFDTEEEAKDRVKRGYVRLLVVT